MSKAGRIGIIAAVALVAVALAGYRVTRKDAAKRGSAAGIEATADPALPSFVEIGAKSCVPCIMMAEVMDDLRTNYPGRLNIVFHDLEIDDSHAATYGVKVIPTQVLLAPDGTELFRHEGFYPADEIVAQWRELGYDLGEPAEGREAGFLASLFSRLTKAVEGAAWLALLAAFVWGVLSILLSPCHLASIPLIVGFIEKQGRTGVARAFGAASLFSAGILVTIALIGIITAWLGRMAGDVGAWGNYLVAVIFLAVGLYLLGVVNVALPGASGVNMKRRGLLAAFILGLVFGIALGPCTFAYMAPVLGLVFKVGSENMLYAAALLLLYGIGHCSVIVLAGGFTEYVQHYIHWSGESKATEWVKRICGLLVLLGGYWLLWTA